MASTLSKWLVTRCTMDTTHSEQLYIRKHMLCNVYLIVVLARPEGSLVNDSEHTLQVYSKTIDSFDMQKSYHGIRILLA